MREVERLHVAARKGVTEAARTLLNPNVEVAKMSTVDGRLIIVLDGAMSEDVRGELFACLEGDAFRRTEFARSDTREFRHHLVEYNPNTLRRTPLFEIVGSVVQAFFPPGPSQSRLEVYRIYTNAVLFGDVAFTHKDSEGPEDVTVLVYPNPSWKSELGGETIFYDEDGEIVEAVEPKPGRICLFRGCITHKGSPPSRLCWSSRFTTAFKFAPPEGGRVGSAPSGR